MRGIYTITCHANGRVYVGGSGDLRARMRQQKANLRRGVGENPPLQRAWTRHGELEFTFGVLKEMRGSTPEERLLAEADAISLFKNPFNIQPPGVPPSQKGRRWTLEQRARQSERMKGRTWTVGVQGRANIAASKRGTKLTDEHRAKISASIRRVFNEPAMREKLRESACRGWETRRRVA